MNSSRSKTIVVIPTLLMQQRFLQEGDEVGTWTWCQLATERLNWTVYSRGQSSHGSDRALLITPTAPSHSESHFAVQKSAESPVLCALLPSTA